MGTVILWPPHARASSLALNPKTKGDASFPEAARASRISRKFSGGISPRDRQLLTAGGPTPATEAAAAVPPKASITASTELSMDPFSSRNVKMSSLHTTELERFQFVAFNGGMAESLKSLSARLKLTREALDLTPAELCRQIDCKPNRWSQYESGDRRITLEVANQLCDEFGLSLDWIYRANPAQLPHALRVKMRQAA